MGHGVLKNIDIVILLLSACCQLTQALCLEPFPLGRTKTGSFGPGFSTFSVSYAAGGLRAYRHEALVASITLTITLNHIR
jgi:hypothetical protein